MCVTVIRYFFMSCFLLNRRGGQEKLDRKRRRRSSRKTARLGIKRVDRVRNHCCCPCREGVKNVFLFSFDFSLPSQKKEVSSFFASSSSRKKRTPLERNILPSCLSFCCVTCRVPLTLIQLQYFLQEESIFTSLLQKKEEEREGSDEEEEGWSGRVTTKQLQPQKNLFLE